MKITGIEIGEYRQFKNIKFVFTYPKGHSKEGQPLEKVCFIGQSGTGKTTLLNVVWELIKLLDHSTGVTLEKILDDKILPDNYMHDSVFHAKYDLYLEAENVVFDREKFITKSDKDFILDWFQKLGRTKFHEIIDIKKLCLYIKDAIAREADAFLFDQKSQPQTFSDFVKTDNQIEKEKIDRDNRVNAAGYQKVISLGNMQSISTWQYLLKDINEYDEVAVARITSIVQNTPKNRVQEELQKWIDADPRHELAEKCLNPILNKFFLEIDTNAGNVPITLRTTGGVKIDASYLSTGTRQILATAIPLYKFDTTDTVVLFDEPERSLFPDIQRDLVKYYTSLAPTAQFFFATHSPIIASTFDPCERFILYFDEDGEVKCRNGVAPIGDDPNDILSEDFGLNELMLEEGLEAYKRYRNLAVAIKNEKDAMRKDELIVERAKLGDQYKF